MNLTILALLHANVSIMSTIPRLDFKVKTKILRLGSKICGPRKIVGPTDNMAILNLGYEVFIFR